MLRDAGALESSGQPKLMRVLELPAPTRPARNAPLHEQLRHVLEEQLGALEAHDPGVRFGDPEDLHQLRVATRRTRALIRATRPLLGDRLAALGEELKLLAGLLGAVRDLDVLLDHLTPEVARLDVDRARGEELLTALAVERTMQRERAGRRDGDAALRGAARRLSGRDRRPRPVRLVDERGQDRGTRRAQASRVPPTALPADPSDDELHAVRIAAKRARYAAELAALGGTQDGARAQ